MIGIFGGTFDPVHFGHLRTALDVYEALALDELRFIPLGNAVHRKQPGSSAARRLAMLQSAIASQPGFVVDEREMRNRRPSYTVHTLEDLRRELGEDLPLCLLLGRDAFDQFPDWHQPERILELAHLVVMDRPGSARDRSQDTRFRLQLADQSSDLRERPHGLILHLPVTRLEISSSDIRHRLQTGRSIRWLVPETVLKMLP